MNEKDFADVKLLQELLIRDEATGSAFVDLMDSIATHSAILAEVQSGDPDGPTKSSEWEVASDLVALWRAFERAKASRGLDEETL
jgi:hypothetical protein